MFKILNYFSWVLAKKQFLKLVWQDISGDSKFCNPNELLFKQIKILIFKQSISQASL